MTNVDLICTEPDCGALAGSRSVCADHYAAWLADRIAGRPVRDLPKAAVTYVKDSTPPAPRCIVDDCTKPRTGKKDRCVNHQKSYNRRLRKASQ